MIEMHFWEQLAVLSQCRTMSEAAEKLNLTQPALSRSMKKLEDLLEVSLFERGYNRIMLNDSGKLAAEYAARLLEYESDIIERLRAQDRNRKTISIGSCAPVPLRELVPKLMERFPQKSISSEILDEEQLLPRLKAGKLQIVILTTPVEDDGLICRKLFEERMSFAVKKSNPLAAKSSVSFRDINGQTILLYSGIGFWHDRCMKMLPSSRFLLQDDFNTFRELADASDFPFFMSSWHLDKRKPDRDRIILPISDPESAVTYYYAYKKTGYDYLG